MKSAEYLEVVLAFIVCVWAWLLFVNFRYLPISVLSSQNADVLYIEQLARDLNSGGHLFQWRLTQAAYLFPDVAIARILALIHGPIGFLAIEYQLLFGLALIFAWSSVLPGEKKSYFYSFAVLLYGVSLWSMLYSEGVSPYFGLIGHHSGVGLFIPILYYLVWESLRSENAVFLFLLLIGTWIGCMSDGLILFVVILPTVLYLTLSFLGSNVRFSAPSIFKTVFSLLLALVLSRTFSYTDPFPQDREFLAYFAKQFPKLAWPSLRQFVSDIAAYSVSSPLAAFFTLAFIAAYCLLCAHSTKGVKQPSSNTAGFTSFVSFGLVCAFPLVLSSQILLGLYQAIATSRQWAMLVFATILMAVYLIRNRPWLYRSVAFATALFLVSCMYVRLMGKHGALPDDNPYEALAQCAMHEFPAGTAFVGDYWMVRPLEMYSGGAIKGVPVIEDGPVFTNAGKVAQIRKLKPKFVATGYSVKKSKYAADFGIPDRVVCSQAGPPDNPVELLDYSKSETFTRTMAARAAAAY